MSANQHNSSIVAHIRAQIVAARLERMAQQLAARAITRQHLSMDDVKTLSFELLALGDALQDPGAEIVEFPRRPTPGESGSAA